MIDPIVQEVRAAQMEHAKKFNYDMAAICADLRRIEKRCGHKLVSREPKRIEPTSLLHRTSSSAGEEHVRRRDDMTKVQTSRGMVARGVLIACLASCMLGCSSPDWATVSESRWNYFDAVRSHFIGHQLWRDNNTISDSIISGSSGSWTRAGAKGQGKKEFLFRSQSPQIQEAVLSSLVQIYHDMDVFTAPCTSVISQQDGLLASPEGWVKFRSRWLTDDNRVTDTVKVLLVEEKVFFTPQSPPTEKQDLHRLTWVTWSPPLDKWYEKPSNKTSGGDVQ